MRFSAVAILVSLSAIIGGCVAKTGSKDATAGSQGGISKVCTQTTCDQCMASSDAECNDCWNTCSGVDLSLMAECTSTCDEICGSTHACEQVDCGTNSTCVDWKREVDLPEHVDQKVLRACRAENQQELHCSPSVLTYDCDVASRILRPEMASILTCYSTTSCSSNASCGAPPARSTLGDDLCHACNDQDSCDSATRQGNDALGDMLTPSMQAALHSCIAQSSSCLDAWDCEDVIMEKLLPGYEKAISPG